MVWPLSRLRVVDNSGVNIVKCIHIFGKHSFNYGSVGDCFVGVIVSIKKKSKNSNYKRGDLVKCLILHTKKEVISHYNNSGNYFRFPINNQAILINKQYTFRNPVQFVGSRVLTCCPNKLSQKKFNSIFSLTNKSI